MMMIAGLLMILVPDFGYHLIALIISISLAVYGLRQIVYYFTMTRYMAGGGDILFIGIVALDFGIFTGSLLSLPMVYVVIYLVFTYAFTALVDFLRALEARKYHSPYWKRNLISGIVNFVLVILCVAFLFMRTTGPIVYIYGGGLIYSAVTQAASAFRRTAIVYIQ